MGIKNKLSYVVDLGVLGETVVVVHYYYVHGSAATRSDPAAYPEIDLLSVECDLLTPKGLQKLKEDLDRNEDLIYEIGYQER